MDPGDELLSPAETSTLLRERVHLFEKVDGLNVGVGVSKRNGLYFVSRVRGVVRPDRVGVELWSLLEWAVEHAPLFLQLPPSELVYGEWIDVPSFLPYPRRPAPFIALTLERRGALQRPWRTRGRLESMGFEVPPSLGSRLVRLEQLEPLSRRSKWGGPAEGLIIERGRRIAKFVRRDFRKHGGPPSRVEVVESRPAPTSGRFVKRFSLEREREARVEAAVLAAIGPARIAPRLHRVRKTASSVELELSNLPGTAWPPNASPRLAATLGNTLARFHGSCPTSPGAEPPSTSTRLAAERYRSLGARTWADIIETRLLPFLRLHERQSEGVAVTCHGDLKASNVHVHGGSVWLLDFDRACPGEAAWELACAMDRLNLDAKARQALLVGYRATPSLAFRTQLFRLAWRVALPSAVLFARELPGPTGFELAAAGRRAALATLVRWASARSNALQAEAFIVEQALASARSRAHRRSSQRPEDPGSARARRTLRPG